MNITVNAIEKMVLIVARDKPNILKLTSLQLIVFSLNCFKTPSFVKVSDKFPVVHEKILALFQNGKKLKLN